MRCSWLLLALITLGGLALRLLAWRWHEQYPLGGDEREYLDQALALINGQGYHELKLMRPPLYSLFLAGGAWLVDSSTQGLRLIQALVSTATIPLTFLWSRALLRYALAPAEVPPAPALLAALLAALSYSLALNASELLTEALFLFVLTAALWLLVESRLRRSGRLALSAGLLLGALCLVRSVALPLIPLGALWLWREAGSGKREAGSGKREAGSGKREAGSGKREADSAPSAMPPDKPDSGSTQRTAESSLLASGFWLHRKLGILCVLGALLVILPWTARNALRYQSFILVDTTGQENLWLDNDPAGREEVKRQLYALGEQRGERAQLALSQGLAAIAAGPERFAGKLLGELERFFALEHADDLLDRPAIWVRAPEVWLRLLLGDALWLLLLGAGMAGLAAGPWRGMRPLLLLWALYILATALIFHVELRYRLPLYPALLPAAGWLLARRARAAGDAPGAAEAGGAAARRAARWAGALLASAMLLAPLLYRPYLHEAWRLGHKHLALARADASLSAGRHEQAQAYAREALELDDASALARVALAQSLLRQRDDHAAEVVLGQAIERLPAHPYAHLLLGDLLRRRGQTQQARAELAYEGASLEDLQRWCWNRFTSPPPSRISLGDGLDLGWIEGFYAAEGGARWTGEHALLRLSAGLGAGVSGRTLALRVRAPRPPGAPPARLSVLLDGANLLSVEVGAEWQELRLPLPAHETLDPTLLLELRSDTVVPHDYVRASHDGRALGVELDEAQVLP